MTYRKLTVMHADLTAHTLNLPAEITTDYLLDKAAECFAVELIESDTTRDVDEIVEIIAENARMAINTMIARRNDRRIEEDACIADY